MNLYVNNCVDAKVYMGFREDLTAFYGHVKFFFRIESAK